MSYAIISVGGKQYRVSAGERLLVDRARARRRRDVHAARCCSSAATATRRSRRPASIVTAKVVDAGEGPKIRIGKYKQRTGYKRHTGFRASLTQIEIESIGGAGKSTREAGCEAEGRRPGEGRGAGRGGAGSRRAPRGLRRPHRRAGEGGGSRLGRRRRSRAALEYEQAHGKRKGAIAALEAAIAEEET